MPLDYDEAKRFFAEKMAADWFGHGRFESAVFHTAQHIWELAETAGYDRAVADLQSSGGKPMLSS